MTDQVQTEPAAAPAAPAATPEPTTEPNAQQLRQEALERAKGGEPTTEPTAEPKPNGEDKNFARMASALRRHEVEKQELTARLEAQEKRAAILDKLTDPKARYDALAELGIKYEDWTTEVLRSGGHLEEDTIDYEKLPPEVRERLQRIDEIEKRDQERQEREQQAELARAQAADLEVAKQILAPDKYPLAAVFASSPAQLNNRFVEAVKQYPDDDPKEIAQRCAEEVERSVLESLSETLPSIAKSDKGKALLRKALGLDDTPPAPEPDPSTSLANPDSSSGGNRPPRLSNEIVAEPGDDEDLTSLSPQELRKRALRKLRASR